MNKVLLVCLVTLSFGIISKVSNGQIVSADTVCVGNSIDFTVENPLSAKSYTWEFGTSSLTPVMTTSIPIPGTATDGTAFSVVDQAAMVFDTASGTYHAFVTSCSVAGANPSVQRLDFGANPHGVPVVTDLGNPSGAFINWVYAEYSNLESVEIVLDDEGVFHAFFTNRGLVHWVFGDGLTSPPTEAIRIFEDFSVLGMGMQLNVVHYDGAWYLFAGQSYGQSRIVRFDLGPDLNAIPAVLPNLFLPPTVGDFSDPSYFAIIERNGNWYMFVSLLQPSSNLVRYDFGGDLLNGTPTVTSLSVPASSTSYNRGINFIASCDTFYMVGIGQDGNVESFDFENDIENTPTATSLGTVYGPGVNMNILSPYWYNDTLWALSGNWNDNPVATVYRFPLLGIPSGNAVTKYWNPETNYTFTDPGVYDVTLFCDQGDARGPFAYCKSVRVNGLRLGADTIACMGETINIVPTVAIGLESYLWSTGETSETIDVTTSGTYWLTAITESGCITSDTIRVDFSTPPPVNLGPDKNICVSSGVTLTNLMSESGVEYLWNTGSTAHEIFVTAAGTYWLKATRDECFSTDTIRVTFTQDAGITIKFDEDFLYKCREDSLIIEPLITPAGVYTYQWTPEASFLPPGSANIIYYGDTAINLKLRVTNADGCYNVDSVDIKVFDPRPIVVGPVDTGVCSGGSLTITAEGGVKYQWIPSMYLDSDTAAIVTVTPLTSTNYVLLAEDINGCTYQKEVDIAVYSNAVVSLPDSVTIYSGESVEMPMESNCLYFSWFPPSGLSSTVIGNPIAQPEVRTRYFVNASTEHGCVTSDSIDVLVKGEVIDIPNAFVPGDHSNPVFKPVARGIVQLHGFKIFNRWGNLVFETTDINKGWDGTFNGNTQPVGVYVYTIEATTASGNRFVKQGNVTLLR